MKKVLSTLILFLSFVAIAQEDLTLSEDLTVTNGQELSYNTLDLNGFDLELRNNSSLTVVNLLGPGNVSTISNGNTGNNAQPILNVTGYLDCENLTFEGQQAYSSDSQFTPCVSLSINQPNLDIRELPMGLSYKVISLSGQKNISGITDLNTINQLPRNQIFILKVEGFKAVKVIY